MERASQSRKTIKVGTVLSSAMDKTVVVRVDSMVMHKLYHRFIQRTNKFMAHDENNECQVGDRVQIIECRPLSRNKRWRVAKVVERRTAV
jgi:small subunit ribosomal protein S17